VVEQCLLHHRVKCPNVHHFQEEAEEGTRLSVKNMMNNIIEATILNGKFKGEDVLLPRISMIPTDMSSNVCNFLMFKSLYVQSKTVYNYYNILVSLVQFEYNLQ
jgi:hypothetical protein